ncbi:MAG: sulfate permease [Porticoccaceae bacterium]|jgi:sulfate permease, SulP family|nr:MAG: sulfate:proton symporter [SAR92 bacterium BACL16 MAG-120619-bin48]MDO7634353.1 sulfate permease [Porticoccaceae bacterium]MDP4655397.1 sulfate permease [Alphaproteobacteria bacterium]MDP4744464.1 sulfate permease [Porticoccaceae bacterium]MDP4753100.1 sulfate permease [Porticoccaceae bacterium]
MLLKNLFLRLPAAAWLRDYNTSTFKADMVAGVVVTMMLIPQSLAYALLAGLPAETGLYASIFPLIAYAVFGSSRALSVGPVAVVSLMTMVALSKIVEQGSVDYISAATALALLTGGFLLLMGTFRLGFIANFLSHTVVSGFITASGILIALSQLRHIVGISAHGDTAPEILRTLAANMTTINGTTAAIGLLVLVFLFWARSGVAPLLTQRGLTQNNAALIAKAAPVIGVVTTIFCVWYWRLDLQGVAIVGTIPTGLPRIAMPQISFALIEQLWLPALSIAIIGYVESVSVGKTLAAKKRTNIDTNQELFGLGAANVASAISGGFPVTGGLSRSVVNYDAGAVTQAASIYAAIGIAFASLYLTPALYFLPKATLAATIIVAVLSIVDLAIVRKTWTFSASDFRALMITILGTLLFGVEAGVLCGVLLSIGLYLYRTSIPHIAEVGLVEGTQHFRNIQRYRVTTNVHVLNLRVDESLFFANASFLETLIYNRIYANDKIAHVVLMCSAINEIDYSALEVLEMINERLRDQGICLHLSEVKGPVMDTLRYSGLTEMLSGNIYLTQFDAFQQLNQLTQD